MGIMKKSIFKIFKAVSVLCLMLLYFLLACAAGWWLMKEKWIKFPIDGADIIVVCLVYCFVLYILLALLEGLEIGRRRLLDLGFGFFCATLAANVIAAFVCSVFTLLPLRYLFLVLVLAEVIECLAGFVWIMSCHRVYERFHFRQEAIFIYGNREDEGEYVRVNNTINKYFTISRSIDYQIGTEKILKEIQESSVVFLGDIPVEIRNVILKFCMSGKIECYSIPKISDIYIQNADVLQLNDKLLLKYPRIGIAEGRQIAKRLMDILVSLFMLGCASPVMLIIAILIKKEDGGDILYCQDRVTMGGRPFVMYKFRSMRSDSEKYGARLAQKNDSRVTKVGRVIRNLHFDELPQLVNVLRGEMSLVGPRPERQEFIDAYAQRIPEFPERLKVKGGLTGYAQVYGRYNTEPEDKIKYDLYYIYNYSLWLDIKLLILTVRILFQKENTEGVEEGQISAIKERKKDSEKKQDLTEKDVI